MGDTRSEVERLPWLDVPRRPTPAAARRKVRRGPIFALLALFLIGSVGVMSFLVGRGSVPLAPAEAPTAPPVPTRPSATMTLPPPTIVEPVPAPVIEQVEPAPPRRATRPRRAVVRRKASTSPPAPSALEATRQAQESTVSPPVLQPASPVPVFRPVSPPPPPLVRATQVIQLGTYRSRWRADAAHRRLTRAYPYVRTLPKVVRPIQPNGSRRTFYRLQYQAYSPEYARILCRNFRAIGRGCAVLPAGR